MEVENLTEDKKYRMLDEFEKTVRNKLGWSESQFELKVLTKVSSSKVDKDRLIEEGKAVIIDRKCLIFDSYKEASINRNKQKGQF
jgi:hypothetical protein